MKTDRDSKAENVKYENVKDDLKEVKFRGLQYNLFEDCIEIIAKDTDLPKAETKKYLIHSIVKWQHDHNSSIAPVRLMDPPIREKCVANIMDNFKEIIYEEESGATSNIEQGIADALKMFKDKYMYQDEWD
jgi:hypothetical protein